MQPTHRHVPFAPRVPPSTTEKPARPQSAAGDGRQEMPQSYYDSIKDRFAAAVITDADEVKATQGGGLWW